MQKLTDLLEPTKTVISTQTSPISQTIPLSDSPSASINLEDIAPERRRTWVELLTEAYAALMRDLPAGNRLKLIIRAFEDVNREIPTRVLRTVYRYSMKQRTAEGWPGYWDARSILAAYENAPPGTWSTANQAAIAKVSEDTAANCPTCFGAGFRQVSGPIAGVVRCDHIPEEAK